MTQKQVKKPSARKSLCIFTNILDVRKKNASRQVRADKLKRKAIKSWTTPWALNPKQKVNYKINDQIKKSLYNCIMHHPQVFQSPIVNDCLKVNIDGHTEPQLVKTLLLQVSIWDIHSSLVSEPVDGGLKEAIDA